MWFAALMFRCMIAFVAGWMVYMLVAMVDLLAPVGGIEAVVGAVFQAVMGAVITAAAVTVLGVVGLPFYLLRGNVGTWAWRTLCTAVIFAGATALLASRLPAYTVHAVPSPDEPGLNAPIDVGNPTLEISGWLALLFGIIHVGGPRPAKAAATV